jgi:hypothetical protein
MSKQIPRRDLCRARWHGYESQVLRQGDGLQRHLRKRRHGLLRQTIPGSGSARCGMPREWHQHVPEIREWDHALCIGASLGAQLRCGRGTRCRPEDCSIVCNWPGSAWSPPQLPLTGSFSISSTRSRLTVSSSISNVAMVACLMRARPTVSAPIATAPRASAPNALAPIATAINDRA